MGKKAADVWRDGRESLQPRSEYTWLCNRRGAVPELVVCGRMDKFKTVFWPVIELKRLIRNSKCVGPRRSTHPWRYTTQHRQFDRWVGRSLIIEMRGLFKTYQDFIFDNYKNYVTRYLKISSSKYSTARRYAVIPAILVFFESLLRNWFKVM